MDNLVEPKGDQMDISTAIPAPVRIARPRLYGLVALAAAVGIAVWAIVAFGGGSGSQTGMTKADKEYVTAITSLSPAALRATFGTPSNAELRSAEYAREVAALTPRQLIAAFGTDTREAATLASLSPRDRQWVEAIMALTPAQLRAAFGTP